MQVERASRRRRQRLFIETGLGLFSVARQRDGRPHPWITKRVHVLCGYLVLLLAGFST